MAVPNTTNGANTYLPPSPVVQPFLTITNITRAMNCVVTVEEDNSYIVGQVVYFSVPTDYGMVEINGMSGEIIAISGLDFTVNINTINFGAFVTPGGLHPQTPAKIAPAGSRNIYNNTTVPFHSKGNIGN